MAIEDETRNTFVDDMLGDADDAAVDTKDTDDTKQDTSDDDKKVTDDTAQDTSVLKPEGDDSSDTSETDDTKDDDQVKALFKQLGLDRKYRSLEDALRSIPEADATITKLSQQQSQTNRQVAELVEQMREQRTTAAPRVEFDPDAFEADPVGHLRRLGLVTKEEVLEEVDRKVFHTIDRREAKEFAAEQTDFEERKPRMDALLQQYPEITMLPRTTVVKILYNLAGPAKPANGSRTVTKPAPGADKKENATTSGGKASGKRSSGGMSLEQWMKMSPEQMEAYEAKHGGLPSFGPG